MAIGLAIGIIGPSIFTVIIIFGLTQYSEFWPFIPVAIISWTGVALIRKWHLAAGITQILIAVSLPFVFYFLAAVIDPGSFGASLGLILIACLCSIPLSISGVIIIISCKKVQTHQRRTKAKTNNG